MGEREERARRAIAAAKTLTVLGMAKAGLLTAGEIRNQADEIPASPDLRD